MHSFQISDQLVYSNNNSGAAGISNGIGGVVANTSRDSRRNTDFVLLERLVSSLLESQNHNRNQPDLPSSSLYNDDRSTPILNRLRPLSRSLRMDTLKRNANNNNTSGSPTNSANIMPTIRESNGSGGNRTSSWSSDKARRILNSIANAPKRFSQSGSGSGASGGHGNDSNDEENINLTQNILN